MTLEADPPRSTADATPEQVAAFLAKRDLTVDLVRIGCVMLVVVIHTLMVGIATVPSLAVVDPAQREPWFKFATWGLQIMPLFFVVGGFASWQAWHSLARRGGTAGEFFRTRVLRLAYPALIWYAVWAALLWGARGVGAPAAMTEQLAGGFGMPLWFLAAYLLTQLCVPQMVRLHKQRPYATVAGLLLGALSVDTLRFGTGVSEVGLVNLLFVWLLAQQLGFFYADGSLARLPRWSLPVIAAVALGGVALLGSARELLSLPRGYSLDMLDNLNPPTVPLVLIGVAHTALLLLAKPALDRLMSRRAAQGAVLFLGSRAMTIYLWHLPFVILLSAAILVLPLPQPGTAAWWWARIPTVLLTYALVGATSLLVARFERGPRKGLLGQAPGVAKALLIALCVIAPPFYAMQFRLDMGGLLWGTALLALGCWLSLGQRAPRQAAVDSGQGAAAL